MPGQLDQLRQLVSDFTDNHRLLSDSTITEVLDDASDVYLQAEFLKIDSSIKDVKDRTFVEKCSTTFLKVMQEILGTDDEISTLSKMEERMSNNKIDGFETGYLPGQTSRLNAIINPFTATTKAQFLWRSAAAKALAVKRNELMVVEPESRLRDKGIGLGAKPTRMFTKQEREKYRVFLRGGTFCKYDRLTLKMEPYNSLGMQSHGKLHFAAYVIDADGAMFAFNHLDKSDQVAHSSLVGGGPVRAAGEVCIVQGVLHVITTHSGHYQPGKGNLYQALNFFKAKGIALGNTIVHFVVDPGLNSPKCQLPFIRPTEPGLKQLFEAGDIDARDIRAYMGLTKFVYRATNILEELDE